MKVKKLRLELTVEGEEPIVLELSEETHRIEDVNINSITPVAQWYEDYVHSEMMHTGEVYFTLTLKATNKEQAKKLMERTGGRYEVMR